MGSVLGVAVFGSISASVFTSQMAHVAHGSIGSLGAAAAVGQHAGGTYGAAVLHAAASAFVTGADRAVLAGAIATLVGALIAVRTLRAPRRTPVQALEAPVAAAEVLPAPAIEVPAAAEVPIAAGAARG
jgi:hypothetical protein